jgi:hypothetical protein
MTLSKFGTRQSTPGYCWFQVEHDALLKHFGSLNLLASASVEELLPFVSRPKALVSSQTSAQSLQRQEV